MRMRAGFRVSTRSFALLTLLVLSLAAPRQARAEDAAAPAPGACGVEIACKLANGEYRYRMPEDWDGRSRVGAIVFLHGYRGTADHEIHNMALSGVASDLGLALVTPQGEGGSWSFPGAPRRHRDEIAFMNTVLDDIIANHSIDPQRIVASGFSSGGSMVWYLACYMGERFAGFVPVAGAFWEPQPSDCPSREPNLFHVHGLSDRTVPMAGRAIGRFARQGDVGVGLRMWMHKGACTNEKPEEFDIDKLKLTCQRRTHCTGKTIELCLHPGGHRFDAAWIKRAVRELATKKGWDIPQDPRD